MQLLNLTWGAGASVAAGIVLEKYKLESKPIQVIIPMESSVAQVAYLHHYTIAICTLHASCIMYSDLHLDACLVYMSGF